MTASAMRVSVVIPVLHDDAELDRLLGQLATLAPAEILVVDGVGSAATRAIVLGHGARHEAGPAGRGRQLRLGAERATGEVLWFLHADAEVPADALRRIAGAVRDGATGGHFRFGFRGGPRPWKRMLATLVNLRCRFGGVAYGDQGLFATRAAYDAAGGFADAPLFEEVPLVRGLQRTGRFRELAAVIGVSPRRWERDGWLRRTLENRALALAYAAGVAPARLEHWYRHRRGPAARTP